MSFEKAKQYLEEKFNLSRTTLYAINEVMDMQPLVDCVLSIYRSVPEEERADPDDPEYLARFDEVAEREDFKQLMGILRAYRDANGVDDVYVETYDYETERGGAIADAEEDPAFVFRTGYWIKENMDVVNRFQFWDGEDRHTLHVCGIQGEGLDLYLRTSRKR